MEVAFLEEGVALRWAPSVMPYLRPAAAIFVAVTGLYILYYWTVKRGFAT